MKTLPFYTQLYKVVKEKNYPKVPRGAKLAESHLCIWGKRVHSFMNEEIGNQEGKDHSSGSRRRPFCSQNQWRWSQVKLAALEQHRVLAQLCPH
jgi:hypothetical protein